MKIMGVAKHKNRRSIGKRAFHIANFENTTFLFYVLVEKVANCEIRFSIFLQFFCPKNAPGRRHQVDIEVETAARTITLRIPPSTITELKVLL